MSGRSFWFYLGKLFYPHPLVFIYPRWQIDPHALTAYAYPIATAGVLIVCWMLRSRLGRGWFAGLIHFYVGTSLLILLVVLYMTRYTFVSDHWQYFGCMSILAIVAARAYHIRESVIRCLLTRTRNDAGPASPPMGRGRVNSRCDG